MITTDKLVKRADDLIALAQRTLASERASTYGSSVDSTLFYELRSSSLSFIEMVYGSPHTYYKEFAAKAQDNDPYHTRYAFGILTAIRSEIAGGWLTTVRGLIAAEFFADFLDMADHLLEQGYKDPAAVLAGSVLEEHLRQLAGKQNVPVTEQKSGKTVPRKADSINADLVKAGAYNVLEQKSVTSWLDLRNRAAHGKYTEYNAQQVGQMIEGIRGFMLRKAV